MKSRATCRRSRWLFCYAKRDADFTSGTRRHEGLCLIFPINRCGDEVGYRVNAAAFVGVTKFPRANLMLFKIAQLSAIRLTFAHISYILSGRDGGVLPKWSDFPLGALYLRIAPRFDHEVDHKCRVSGISGSEGNP